MPNSNTTAIPQKSSSSVMASKKTFPWQWSIIHRETFSVSSLRFGKSRLVELWNLRYQRVFA